MRHHYDVSNEFFALFLDASMTYSLRDLLARRDDARGGAGRKRELVCTKLALQARASGCSTSAAAGARSRSTPRTRHGVHVTGITLSEPQAELARERAEAAGVADQVEIRVMDYRELRGEPFDAIASIGMVEHVGASTSTPTRARSRELLQPGGRLLNHGIARLRHGDAEAGPFSERYVFPDAAPLHLVARSSSRSSAPGFETDHVEGFRARLRANAAALGAQLRRNLDEAGGSAGAERVRVWRLYLRAARTASRPASRRSTRCSATGRASRPVSGLTAAPRRRSSKCRCGPVE